MYICYLGKEWHCLDAQQRVLEGKLLPDLCLAQLLALFMSSVGVVEWCFLSRLAAPLSHSDISLLCCYVGVSGVRDLKACFGSITQYCPVLTQRKFHFLPSTFFAGVGLSLLLCMRAHNRSFLAFMQQPFCTLSFLFHPLFLGLSSLCHLSTFAIL